MASILVKTAALLSCHPAISDITHSGVEKVAFLAPKGAKNTSKARFLKKKAQLCFPFISDIPLTFAIVSPGEKSRAIQPFGCLI
jgi:hypothetical protein